jgi:protein-L-isoaspartate(D-aspartate) O-methyltransferase
MSSRQFRARLVAELAAAGDVRSDTVRRAFLAVPRERFVPEASAAEGLERVYRNEPIVTKWAAGMPTSSSSQPSVMAHMLEALSVAPGHRVLEIGLGTGYNAALLKTLVGRTGRVTSIEQDADCVREATDRLDGYDVETVLGDGYGGVASAAPYDRIIVTASVISCPQTWWHQLVPGGLLVVPLRFTDQMEAQAIAVFARSAEGFDAIGVIPGGFMALRHPDEPAHTASPFISAYDHTTSPPGVLIQLGGPAIRLMTQPARTRILSTVLTLAKSRTWTGSGLSGAAWHLQIAVPKSRPAPSS